MSRFSIRATFGADASEFNAALASMDQKVRGLSRHMNVFGRGIGSAMRLGLIGIGVAATYRLAAAVGRAARESEDLARQQMDAGRAVDETTFRAGALATAFRTVGETIRDNVVKPAAGWIAQLIYGRELLENMQAAAERNAALDRAALDRERANEIELQRIRLFEERAIKRMSLIQREEYLLSRIAAIQGYIDEIASTETDRAKARLDLERHRIRLADTRRELTKAEAAATERIARARASVRDAAGSLTTAASDRFLPSLGEMANEGRTARRFDAQEIGRLEERARRAALRGNIDHARELTRRALDKRRSLEGLIQSAEADPLAAEWKTLQESLDEHKKAVNELRAIRQSLDIVSI